MKGQVVCWLDEPSLGLDHILVDQIFKFVAEIVKDGVTILLVARGQDTCC